MTGVVTQQLRAHPKTGIGVFNDAHDCGSPVTDDWSVVVGYDPAQRLMVKGYQRGVLAVGGDHQLGQLARQVCHRAGTVGGREVEAPEEAARRGGGSNHELELQPSRGSSRFEILDWDETGD